MDVETDHKTLFDVRGPDVQLKSSPRRSLRGSRETWLRTRLRESGCPIEEDSSMHPIDKYYQTSLPPFDKVRRAESSQTVDRQSRQ
jgi:hypothetical protein